LTFKVGIPRALFYHEFSVLWQTFFDCLNAEVIVSGETNKLTVDLGAARVVEEACLPVKIYFGHVAQLPLQKLDYLFIPRLVSIEKKTYICPKIMGLPDMLNASGLAVPPLIKPVLNLVSRNSYEDFLREIGRFFGQDISRIKRAWQSGLQEQKKHESALLGDVNQAVNNTGSVAQDKLTILLLGHQYMIHDRHINLNLLEKLKLYGCDILLPCHISKETQAALVKKLPKSMFWSHGRVLLGSAFYFSSLPGPKGVIILSSFGCGIDSFVVNMVIRYLNKAKIPSLSITLDEHTGEAGIDTRVEAFFDMLCCRRIKDENYFSAYGQFLGHAEGAFGVSWADSYHAAPHK